MLWVLLRVCFLSFSCCAVQHPQDAVVQGGSQHRMCTLVRGEEDGEDMTTSKWTGGIAIYVSIDGGTRLPSAKVYRLEL